jgi:tripartite-type tricarboxylate transporter receptor subunit TctC
MTPPRTPLPTGLPRRGGLALLGTLPLAATAGVAAQEAAWPTRPVRILVPFPAGSGTDMLARFYAERLARSLGQSVLVENMGGANGVIATRAAARAAPDGYTVFFGTVSTHAANPNLLRAPGFDPIRDFAPVSMLTINALALLVREDFPARDLKEFIAHARANPGKLNFGIGNAGGLAGTHLLTSATGIRAEQITYRGTPAAMTDLLGGRIQFMVVDLGPAVPHLRAGTIRALAVTTARRIDLLPDVPTMQEGGIPGFDFTSWNAVWVPAGTPAPIIARLNREIVAIGESEEAKRFAAGLGITSTTSTPEALGAFTEQELARWARIVEEAGIPRE